jgi:hypothetical protein
MKYLFLLVLLAFVYRAFFRPKVIVEHRHFYDKKPKDSRRLDAENADYEEVK